MKILSKREIMKEAQNNKKYCFDIIYEWEDILAEKLQIPVLTRSNSEFNFDEKCRKIYKKIKIPFFRLFSLYDRRGSNIVMFDASTKRQDGIYNNSHYIPCLIDYFLSEDEYEKFLKAYGRNLLVLVSSREVYEYLLAKDCPIPIEHFPLSLADGYWQDVPFEKKYDLVMFARQNPLLTKYIDRYEATHKDFKLVRRKYEDGHYIYYLSATGEIVSICDTHEDYVKIVSESKIAVYTTPGMDGTRTDANGWNQVTPHFLEEIAGQCHIIARYPDNADTRWYEMDQICPCVSNYEEFEKLVDEYRTKKVDLTKYKLYLNKHVTSKRADLLKEIMNRYGLY